MIKSRILMAVLDNTSGHFGTMHAIVQTPTVYTWGDRMAHIMALVMYGALGED